MKIALGTVQFGTDYGISNLNGQTSLDEVKKILEFSRSAGIKKIDTAKNYGETEKIIGEVGIKDFEIITKLPKISSNELKPNLFIDNQIQDSLAKMKISKIDTLLLHNTNDLLNENGKKIFDKLIELKKEGVINKFGISTYEKDEIDQLNKNFNFDVIQIPFNIFDTRLIKSGYLKKLKKKNVEIHARSIFLQGLLLMKRDNLPSKFRKWNKVWNEWFDWLKKNPNISQMELCLSFALSIQEIDTIIIGVNNVKQLKELNEITKKPIKDNFPKFNIDDKNLLNPTYW